MGRPWSGRPSAFMWGGSGEGFLFLHSEWGPSFRTRCAGCAHRLPIGGGAQRGASGGQLADKVIAPWMGAYQERVG